MNVNKTGNKSLPVNPADAAEEHEITRLFLSKGMSIVQDEMSAVYNLSEEFAASRRNRSYPVYAAITIFTILLAIATVWFTRGIQHDIDRISVGIADFKDLNLAELLASLKRAEMELKDVDEKIALSRQAMDLEVEKILHNAELEIKKVEESNIGQAEKRRLIKIIRDENDKKTKSTVKEYEDRIKEKQKEIREARDKMLVLKEQIAGEKKTYENKIEISVQSYKAEADEQIEKQKREFQNIVSAYKKELADYRDESLKESEKARNTDELLALYKKALIYYAKTRGEHGYVIDPGTGGSMLVDINPYITINKGDHAYILNRESNVLAVVELSPDGIRMKAKVLKRIAPDDIQPFDKILLIKN